MSQTLLYVWEVYGEPKIIDLPKYREKINDLEAAVKIHNGQEYPYAYHTSTKVLREITCIACEYALLYLSYNYQVNVDC